MRVYRARLATLVAFLRGERGALSDAAVRGSELFFSPRLGCGSCHAGFALTVAAVSESSSGQRPSAFHNIGLYDLDGQGAYPEAAPGLEVTDVPEPELGPHQVRIGVRRAGITLDQETQVDGTILMAPLADAPSPDTLRDAGRITVHAGALVRGALYSAWQTDFRGTLHGTLLTRQLYLYESPTTYLGYLRDARLDVTRRPAGYAAPVGFAERRRLVVLSFEEIQVDEAPPPL